MNFLQSYPRRADTLPEWSRQVGPYECRFARCTEDLRAVQRLRYEVFYCELGEGLASGYQLQRDEDRYDDVSHHLMVTDLEQQAVVGTYRLMTQELISEVGGFYSANEFDLSGIPDKILADGVELGRACVSKGHRGRRILQLLWSGITAYVLHYGKRYCFGCASLPEISEMEAAAATETLRQRGYMHPSIRVSPRQGYAMKDAPAEGEAEIPGLVQAYLALGTRVCGPPAYDRDFGTVDYFVLLDVQDIEPTVLSRLTA